MEAKQDTPKWARQLSGWRPDLNIRQKLARQARTTGEMAGRRPQQRPQTTTWLRTASKAPKWMSRETAFIMTVGTRWGDVRGEPKIQVSGRVLEIMGFKFDMHFQITNTQSIVRSDTHLRALRSFREASATTRERGACARPPQCFREDPVIQMSG